MVENERLQEVFEGYFAQMTEMSKRKKTVCLRRSQLACDLCRWILTAAACAVKKRFRATLTQQTTATATIPCSFQARSHAPQIIAKVGSRTTAKSGIKTNVIKRVSAGKFILGADFEKLEAVLVPRQDSNFNGRECQFHFLHDIASHLHVAFIPTPCFGNMNRGNQC